MAALARLNRTIRTFPTEEVTTRRQGAEAQPAEAGLLAEDVRVIWRTVEDLYRTGSYPAVALCLRRRGRVVLDRAIGHARGNAPDDPPGSPLEPVTPDSLFCLFSASKAVTAMLLHLLDDRGQVHLDDAVAEYIPEFARHGKHWITLRHILTHRAGIPTLPGTEVDIDLLGDWDRIIEILCDATPVLPPGRRLAYHALTGGFVIGEVIRRVTGMDIRAFLRREIAEPMGLEHFSYGVANASIARVVANATTGLPVPPPISWLVKRALGLSQRQAVQLSNDPRFLTAIVPAGNIYATADEACRFYQVLLGEGEAGGVRVFAPRTVRRARSETSYLEWDLTLGLPVHYGIGFMLGGDWLSIYGHRTPRAFGHLGFTNIVTWADPERDLAACLMTSGKPFAHLGLWRWLEVMRTIARRCPRDRRGAFRPAAGAG